MKLELNKKDSLFLPQKELARALDGAGEDDLKVLLMLCSITSDGTFDTDECKNDVIEAVGISETEFESAVAYWRGARVLKLMKRSKRESVDTEKTKETPDKKKTLLEEKLPNYSEEEMAEKIDTAKDLKATIDECQQIIGKIFPPADTAVIVGMSDRLGLSGEYITMLAAYCVGTGKKTLRYIEKTACAAYDEGIDTVEKLAAYINKKESLHEAVTEIRRMIGAAERELTSKESRLISVWLDDYGYDVDVLRLAYEKSVGRVQNGQFLPYMGGIIDRWHKQGMKNAEEISEMLTAYEKSRNDAKGGFDTNEGFEKAVNKTLKNKTKRQSGGKEV